MRLGGDMEERKIAGTGFSYSGVRLNKLGASEFTLVTVVIDTSGSVQAYAKDMEAALREIVQSCKSSPRADNLMLRIMQFNSKISEVHGYKLLANCNLDDYKDFLHCYGCTALYDASENAVLAQNDYAKHLTGNDCDVNDIVIVLTDGCDNESSSSPAAVKVALEAAMRAEASESTVSILIGVGTAGDPAVSKVLDSFHKAAGFSQYVETKDASAKTLAKLAQFVSKSISSQSQSLGTGGPSQLLSLSI